MIKMVITNDMDPFTSKIISTSPFYLLYNSHEVSQENLVVDQLIIPLLLFFLIFISCLLEFALIS